MTALQNEILLIGESGVGKTHYGAQLLQRLMKGEGRLKMDGAASNLEPFEAALDKLNEGVAASHTAISTYVDSIWPVIDGDGRKATLIWPEYGGEQVRQMIETLRVSAAWQERIKSSQAWLLLLRIQKTRAGDDIFSRPLRDLRGVTPEDCEVHFSDQARLVELLQMLIFAGSIAKRPMNLPRLAVLLTCWDELGVNGTPADILSERLPMLASFIHSNWKTPIILGLSALERPLSASERDMDYVVRGPEEFGFLVAQNGSKSPDLTLPIDALLTSSERVDHRS